MSILKWAKVSDMDDKDIKLKLLLYGDSGTGKTWTASTAPNPVFLLTEPNGLPTIRVSSPDAVVIQADEGHGGMDTVRSFLRAAKDGTLQSETGGQTVVLDSLNELQRMLRDEIMASKVATTKGEVKFTLKDWGTLTDRMRGLVRAFRDLPMHIVAITHADSQVDEASGERHVQPQFQGRALPNEIAGYFSAVGLMYRERSMDEDGNAVTNHRVLLNGPSTILCKGLPGLGAVEDPELQEWLTKLASYDKSTGEPASKPVDPLQTKAKTRSRRRSRG